MRGARVSHGAGPARQAARARRRRAARRRGALLHAVAHAAEGAGLAGELPALVRRAPRARAGGVLPALRSALPPLAALRHRDGEAAPRADRGRAGAGRPPGRAAARRALLSRRRHRARRRSDRLPRPRGGRHGRGTRRAQRAVLRDLIMLLDIEHRFSFEYDAYISESFMERRVQPKSTADQTVSSFVPSVGPPARVHRYVDWNDNVTHHFTITRFHDRIQVGSRSLVGTHAVAPPITAVSDAIALHEGPYPLPDFLAFGGPVQLTPALRAAHKAAAPPRRAPLGEHVLALGQWLAGRFEYQKDVTKF